MSDILNFSNLMENMNREIITIYDEYRGVARPNFQCGLKPMA